MTYADLMALLGNWLLPGSLVAIMVSMGLSLTADEFRQVFRNKRALIFGVCSFLFQAEDGIRAFHVTEFRRVLFRSQPVGECRPAPHAEQCHPGGDREHRG